MVADYKKSSQILVMDVLLGAVFSIVLRAAYDVKIICSPFFFFILC